MSIGSLISAGASLLGGFMNRDSARDAQAQQAQTAANNIAMQREFAQSGIQWRVEDARAAGIHPLYALGAQTHSFAPQSISSPADNSMGNAVASMGQDIGRAVNATRSADQRESAFADTVKKLSLEKASLENDVLRTTLASSVQRLKQQQNPPIPIEAPIPQAAKPEDRPQLKLGGQVWDTHPKSSNMEEWEKRYGDDGPASWIVPPMIAWEDYKHQSGGTAGAFRRIKSWLDDRATQPFRWMNQERR